MIVTTARSANSRPRGAARRELLLDAVLRILADTGADAVTHRRVAAVARLPLASTTYWFDSKEQLLTAALELAAQRDVARLQDLARPLADRAVTVDAIVDAIVDPVDAAHPSNRGSLMATYALMLEAARRPALQELSRRWTDAYVDTCGALLARAGSRRPREDARLLVATADGLTIDRLAGGGTTDPRPQLRRVARALLESR